VPLCYHWFSVNKNDKIQIFIIPEALVHSNKLRSNSSLGIGQYFSLLLLLATKVIWKNESTPRNMNKNYIMLPYGFHLDCEDQMLMWLISFILMSIDNVPFYVIAYPNYAYIVYFCTISRPTRGPKTFRISRI
jgi:hypothetical protein